MAQVAAETDRAASAAPAFANPSPLDIWDLVRERIRLVAISASQQR